jgi:hypothetical protein
VTSEEEDVHLHICSMANTIMGFLNLTDNWGNITCLKDDMDKMDILSYCAAAVAVCRTNNDARHNILCPEAMEVCPDPRIKELDMCVFRSNYFKVHSGTMVW